MAGPRDRGERGAAAEGPCRGTGSAPTPCGPTNTPRQTMRRPRRMPTRELFPLPPPPLVHFELQNSRPFLHAQCHLQSAALDRQPRDGEYIRPLCLPGDLTAGQPGIAEGIAPGTRTMGGILELADRWHARRANADEALRPDPGYLWDTWRSIHNALCDRYHGLPRGSTLALRSSGRRIARIRR
jgi:hypothetical protein